MSTVPFTGLAAATATKEIKKTIRDAYEARKKATQTLEQLQNAEIELRAAKADAWASEVVSRGVDPNTVVSTYENAEKELTAHQKKIDAVKALAALVEARIVQLKKTYQAEVVEVLKEQITTIQTAKTADQKEVDAADEAIKGLWKEVYDLDPAAAPSQSQTKK